MIIRNIRFVNLVVILFFLIRCKENEEVYSAQPNIDFVKVEFDEGQPPQLLPSLLITFSITDGDLDFGLNHDQTDFPYQLAYYYLKKDGTRISSDKFERGEVRPNELIQVEDRFAPPFDTLPDPATSCKYLHYADSQPPFYKQLELYADRNENFSNLFLKLFLKEPDGTFLEEDLRAGGCSFGRNGRIFFLHDLSIGQEYLDGPFEVTMFSRQKGQVTYKLKSYSLVALRSRTIKAQFYVKDRALNNSNIAETPEFRPEDL